MKSTKRYIKYFAVTLMLLPIGLALSNLFTYDIIRYESMDDFNWCASCSPVVSINSETEVDSEKEASELFFKLIRLEYTGLTRMMNNNVHVVYDHVTERYYLIYNGFAFFEHTMYGSIDKGSTQLYYIISI